MRTIGWFIYFWLYLLCVQPMLFRMKRMEKQGRLKECEEIAQREARKWAGSLLRLAGVKVSVSGFENIPETSCVYVGNHQGSFDIPLLLSCLDKPHGFLAKTELQKLPGIRSWMKYLNCVFIDRSDPRQSIAALNRSAQLLGEGYSFLIFPEGTRSKSREMGEFKQGAFKMAFKNNSPIVPVVIDGTYQIMEQQGFWIKPAQVSLTILEPIATQGLSKAEAKDLSDRIKAKIQEELDRHTK